MSYKERNKNNYNFTYSKKAQEYFEKKKNFNRASSSLKESLRPIILEFICLYVSNSQSLKNYIQSYIEIRTIDKSDPRIPLRGQDGAFAKRTIPKDTVLGIYTGGYITEDEFKALYNVQQQNEINRYAFNLAYTNDYMEGLFLDGYEGNELSCLNANKTYKEGEIPKKANVIANYYTYQGWRYVVYYSLDTIAQDDELLFDYGEDYWANIG